MKRTWILDWDLQLPNFAAPVVLLRVGVMANLCMLIGAILKQDNHWMPFDTFMAMAAVGEPALLTSMLALGLLWPRLSAKARSFVALFAGSTSVALLSWLQPQWDAGETLRSMLNAMIVSLAICLYFDWRHRRLSPAVAEAKLEALVSRMRPHFLFNAINGIVMLLGKSPSDAEEALLDLSDVFRALLKEGSSLAKFKDEVELTQKYLRIEKMRFRERMDVRFDIGAGCERVLVPTMLLQPLVENAIIHGIETVGSGRIDVRAALKDGRISIVVENPCAPKSASSIQRDSNGIAMENIKQRLALLYDIEAKLSCAQSAPGLWRVAIQLPAHETMPEGALGKTRPSGRG
jgi:two-component system sensor histidine kinase AlgZ